jgi:hypothetical protein
VVVGGPWGSLVKSTVGQGRVDVEEQVDAGGVEDGSTVIVPGCGRASP